MMNKTALLCGGVLGLCFLGAAPLRAQVSGESVVLYEREVFEYSRVGRSDPFRSLLRDPDLGLRFEDLELVGVLYDEDPSRSVVILSQTGSTRRLRARMGDRIGGIRIVTIRPRSVDVVVEEFGIARRATLELKSATEKGSPS